MSTLQFGADFILIYGLMMVGAWLETINGIDGWIDAFFTPVPMGSSGLLISWMEWELA